MLNQGWTSNTDLRRNLKDNTTKQDPWVRIQKTISWNLQTNNNLWSHQDSQLQRSTLKFLNSKVFLSKLPFQSHIKPQATKTTSQFSLENQAKGLPILAPISPMNQKHRIRQMRGETNPCHRALSWICINHKTGLEGIAEPTRLLKVSEWSKEQKVSGKMTPDLW